MKLKIKNIYIPLGILISLFMLPIILTSLYSRPLVDDFSYATLVHDYIKNGNWNIFGLISKAAETVVKFYNSWQGTYTSAFIMSLQPGVINEKYYFIGSFLLMFIGFISFFYFVKTIYKILKIENKRYIFLSILIFAVIFQQIPDMAQGVYWFNGSYHYMFYIFLSLINLTFCIKYLSLKNKKYLILSCLFSLLISGGSQVTSFMNVLMMMFLTIYGIFKKKQQIGLSFLFAIIGFTIMYLAPGTSIRSNILGKTSVIKTIYLTFIRSFGFMSQYISRNTVFYFLAIILFTLFNYKKEYFNDKHFKVSPIIYAFISWIIYCGTIAPSYYSLGFGGPGRVIDAIHAYLIISLTVLIIYSTCYILYKYIDIKDLSNEIILNILFVLFVALGCCWTDCNWYKTFKELSDGKTKAYASSFDERMELLKNFEGDILYVNALPDSIMKFEDITDEKDHWINEVWNEYYGVDTVAIPTTWLNKNDIELYISNKVNDENNVVVISENELKVINDNNNEKYSIKLDSSFDIDTSIGKISLLIYDDDYNISLDETIIKSGNLQELNLFDYLVFDIDKYGESEFELIKIYER